MKHLIISLIFIAITFFAYGQKERKYIRQGNKLYHLAIGNSDSTGIDSINFVKAEDKYRIALEKRPDDFKAAYNIGNAQYPYVRSNSIGGSIQYSSSGHGSMAQEHSREEEVTVRRLPKLNRIRYDLAVLSFVSVFVLITAIFVVYANNKNIKQVVRLISKETVLDSASVIYSPDRSNNISAKPRSTVSASNGEMTSKKWKVIPGNIPVLSNVETGEEKNSKEL